MNDKFGFIQDQIKPTWAKYFLQSIQGQVSGFHNLIKLLLNSFSELDSLIFCVTISNIFDPKCRVDWIP